MHYDIKPNYKVCGPIFGKNINKFNETLKNLSNENIKDIEEGRSVNLVFEDNNINITNDMIDVRVISKEGFNTSYENKLFIILNTKLTNELINEGIVREFISKVQQIRKTNDYEMMDNIIIYYSNDSRFNESIKDYIEFIKKETLAVELVIKDNITTTYDINGIEVGIELEKKD
jgi:isoleucyl-tRNA synthetase